MGQPERYILRNDQIKANALSAIQQAECDHDKPLMVEIRPFKSKRSLAQNRLLWVWNSSIQQHMADHFGQMASAEEWHDILVARLMPSDVRAVQLPSGERYKVGRTRTSQLTIKGMTEYLERLDAYCAEYLRLQLPHPVDLMMEAMGR